MDGNDAPIILIVDDEPVLRMLLAAELEDAGYRTLLAADGQEAIEVLRTTQPSLVLLDLGMPMLDGWGFLTLYRDITGGSLPIVVTSADLPPSTTQRLRALGVNQVLQKPIDPAVMIIRVEQALAEAMLPARTPA
ncbi:MAG TPA: response regulator [Chloroflexota bacterium]|jgi:CheY-like chemotaxis protein